MGARVKLFIMSVDLVSGNFFTLMDKSGHLPDVDVEPYQNLQLEAEELCSKSIDLSKAWIGNTINLLGIFNEDIVTVLFGMAVPIETKIKSSQYNWTDLRNINESCPDFEKVAEGLREINV